MRLLFDALRETGQDARALAGATVAAIGPGTAAELERHGVRADVLPEQFVAEALVEALAPIEVEGRRVLVARAAEARSLLPDALRERGAELDEVALYETVAEPLGDSRARGARACHLRDLHLQLDRALPARLGRAAARGRTRGLDRPDHERDRPGAWPHGARRGRAATTWTGWWKR